MPANVGGRRQGRFRIQGFVGRPFTNTFVNIVTQNATIDQDPLVVPVPTAPSYFYYAAPYPSWGGVTRAIRDGIDGTLQLLHSRTTIALVRSGKDDSRTVPPKPWRAGRPRTTQRCCLSAASRDRLSSAGYCRVNVKELAAPRTATRSPVPDTRTLSFSIARPMIVPPLMVA